LVPVLAAQQAEGIKGGLMANNECVHLHQRLYPSVVGVEECSTQGHGHGVGNGVVRTQAKGMASVGGGVKELC